MPQLISCSLFKGNKFNIKSLNQRELVPKHFKSGTSQRGFAEMASLSPSTVQHIIQRFVRENRIEDKRRKAPNTIFNDHEEHRIVR